MDIVTLIVFGISIIILIYSIIGKILNSLDTSYTKLLISSIIFLPNCRNY